MAPTVFERIAQFLTVNDIEFTVSRHAPVYTSQEAAAVRGAPLASGAKALVCKANATFVLFVLPADRKLDSKGVRKQKGWKSLRFANPAEVATLTGLEPGSIPPFGSLFGLPTHCDERLGEQNYINFNAGDHAISISLRYADYVNVEQPELGSFAAELS